MSVQLARTREIPVRFRYAQLESSLFPMNRLLFILKDKQKVSCSLKTGDFFHHWNLNHSATVKAEGGFVAILMFWDALLNAETSKPVSQCANPLCIAIRSAYSTDVGVTLNGHDKESSYTTEAFSKHCWFCVDAVISSLIMAFAAIFFVDMVKPPFNNIIPHNSTKPM